MNIAFVFPGQGSQKVGMGLELFEKFQEARAVFQTADEALGWKVSELCFHGPEEELGLTSNTQPALLATSVACLVVARKHGLVPKMVAGHSLGECSALVAAGSLELANALRVVRKRGIFMQEAAPEGGMAAILGLDKETVIEICEKVSEVALVEPANFNCPGQIVISGVQEGLAMAMELAKEAGARRVIALNVSGPFHSRLMSPVGDQLAAELEGIEILAPKVPVVSNIDAGLIENAEAVKNALIRQVSGSVRWDDSIEMMIQSGIDTFIEIGPGKVLSGLIKKINREVDVLNVEDLASLEKTIAKMGEVG